MSSTNERAATPLAPKDRFVIGAFNGAKRLSRAVSELSAARIGGDDMFLMAARAALEQRLRCRFDVPAAVADRVAVPVRRPGSAAPLPSRLLLFDELGVTAAQGTLLVSSGSLSARLRQARGEVAASIGALLAQSLGHRNAASLAAQLDAGALLLWITASDQRARLGACDVLLRWCEGQVHVHELAALDARVGGCSAASTHASG
jgi:hypothetical protein